MSNAAHIFSWLPPQFAWFEGLESRVVMCTIPQKCETMGFGAGTSVRSSSVCTAEKPCFHAARISAWLPPPFAWFDSLDGHTIAWTIPQKYETTLKQPRTVPNWWCTWLGVRPAGRRGAEASREVKNESHQISTKFIAQYPYVTWRWEPCSDLLKTTI